MSALEIAVLALLALAWCFIGCNLRAMTLARRATAAYRRHEMQLGDELLRRSDRIAPWLAWADRRAAKGRGFGEPPK